MAAVDWSSLLAGRASGLETRVHGVRVGDSLDAVPLERVTQIEPAFHPPGRGWSSRSGAFDRTEDGRDVPVPREVLLAELREHGGRVFIERVGYELVAGRVRRIWVRGAPLDGVRIAAEEEIARALGQPSGVERWSGGRVHHYPERGLSVAWGDGAVEHIALGPVTWTPPAVGAGQVLHAWLEAAMAGLGGDWTEPTDRATSRWVYHARLMALLAAFELGSPRDFANGAFLAGRPLADYPRLAALVKREHRAQRAHSSELPLLFRWLLRYRTEAEDLLQVHRGWLEASGLVLAGLELTERTNRTVAAALGEVDALIVELISPADRRIPLEEMIARWGWPDVDLHALLLAESD